MFKFIFVFAFITLASATPVREGTEQFTPDLNNLGNNLLPLLFPNLFTIQNPNLNQVAPLVNPLSNVIQPVINPALQGLNNNANQTPIVGALVSKCTGNLLLCILNQLDNLNVVPTNK